MFTACPVEPETNLAGTDRPLGTHDEFQKLDHHHDFEFFVVGQLARYVIDFGDPIPIAIELSLSNGQQLLITREPHRCKLPASDPGLNLKSDTSTSLKGAMSEAELHKLRGSGHG